MKERPILFSAPMVRAILAGTKTQTRRICKPAEAQGLSYVVDCQDGTWGNEEGDMPVFSCPYGRAGDRLWVRETFARIDGQTRPWIETDYRATYTHGDRLGDRLGINKRWTPSIHMPRHASRINLEVTGVRVERLQDISEADAKAEGVQMPDGTPTPPEFWSYRQEFGRLWEEINGASSWEANPWVWVIEVRRA
ncbi:hypothetical protein ACQ858_19720 [Variovorax ureilyticus]|uniref:hypothetical protein n=1 Tax=Variovorax ureilyticus TaxID=1836198 RepID=UPI003D677A47